MLDDAWKSLDSRHMEHTGGHWAGHKPNDALPAPGCAVPKAARAATAARIRPVLISSGMACLRRIQRVPSGTGSLPYLVLIPPVGEQP